jgi:aminoglycoside phosphotransferase (APT) family kinase protein
VESLTKWRLTGDELSALVRRGFGERAEVAGWSELTDGSYNAAYRVTVAGGTIGEPVDLVLKVAPDPRLKLLTHEVDLMRTEVDFYHRAAAVGVPVPRVAFVDFARTLLDTDYVFLSLIPGTPLNIAAQHLSTSQLAALRAELAGITARLHTVHGPAFGYPLRGSRSWQPTWRAAFCAMVDDLLADALRLESKLPMPAARIGELIHHNADALDTVEHPALVHFDLWDGNVFVSAEGSASAGGWRVTGLIDGERALFGDPVAELVSLTLLRDPADRPEVLAGYAAAGGAPIELTDEGVRRRLALYTSYLYLIMGIEGVTRGFDAAHDEFRRWVLSLLQAQLARL